VNGRAAARGPRRKAVEAVDQRFPATACRGSPPTTSNWYGRFHVEP
jgi:hypothetical protein